MDEGKTRSRVRPRSNSRTPLRPPLEKGGGGMGRRRGRSDVSSTSATVMTLQSDTPGMRNRSRRTTTADREQSPRFPAHQSRGGGDRGWDSAGGGLPSPGLGCSTGRIRLGLPIGTPIPGWEMRSLDEYGRFLSNAGLGMDDDRVWGHRRPLPGHRRLMSAFGVAAGATDRLGKV